MGINHDSPHGNLVTGNTFRYVIKWDIPARSLVYKTPPVASFNIPHLPSHTGQQMPGSFRGCVHLMIHISA